MRHSQRCRASDQHLQVGRKIGRIPISGGRQHLGQIPADLAEIGAHHRRGSVVRIAELDGCVQVGTSLEVAGLEPVGQRLEECGDDLMRRRGLRLRRRAHAFEPARPRVFQPGDDQIVLRRKVSIKGGLRHASRRDQCVDASGADSSICEETRGGGQDSVPGGRRGMPSVRALQPSSHERSPVCCEKLRDAAGGVAPNVVGTDHRVRRPAQDGIDAGLVGRKLLNACNALLGPFHLADQARGRVAKG